MSKRELLGHFGVDSGQVLIGAPCYLKDFKNDEAGLTRTYKHATEDRTFVWPKDFSRYDQVIEDGLSMNELIDKGLYKKVPRKVTPTFSYSGACSVTTSDEQGGELDGWLAVVSSTGMGDGLYTVYAIRKEGRIKELIIKFF